MLYSVFQVDQMESKYHLETTLYDIHVHTHRFVSISIAFKTASKHYTTDSMGTCTVDCVRINHHQSLLSSFCFSIPWLERGRPSGYIFSLSTSTFWLAAAHLHAHQNTLISSFSRTTHSCQQFLASEVW